MEEYPPSLPGNGSDFVCATRVTTVNRNNDRKKTTTVVDRDTQPHETQL